MISRPAKVSEHGKLSLTHVAALGHALVHFQTPRDPPQRSPVRPHHRPPPKMDKCMLPSAAARPLSMHLSILWWGQGWDCWGASLAAQKCNARGGCLLRRWSGGP